ncbi:MAG: hypothetical protein M3539_12065 [Acidobacteriota bacterium]|nr:hypothetical protein [Acidobacteriota bacterium]
MGNKENAQTPGSRKIIESLDREFARLHLRSCAVVEATPANKLYSALRAGENVSTLSIGEGVLRCAASIERTFGGITSNLWDDPFEWTLPEHLSTPAKVLDHLNEVEAVRRQAFRSFTDDECLGLQVATPAEETQPLIELLLATLVQATDFQSQAIVAQKILSGKSTSGFII